MKTIEVKVVTRARREEIQKISECRYRIKVSPPPEKGRANMRVIELFAREFGVKKRDIRIIYGEKGNRKILEIRDNGED